MGITCCLQTRFLLTISSPSASIFSGSFSTKKNQNGYCLLSSNKIFINYFFTFSFNFFSFRSQRRQIKMGIACCLQTSLLAAVRGMRTKRVAHSTLVFIALPVRNASLAPTMLFI
ncbi:hypothetical protein NC652_020681 [Populus alba x Populus x berolinensis]|nr:hypothetical protein NC652_020005 [Populus alba x Populus x berolinensis]KAJ6909765.1 hypothetical protein NC652_020681 [Populus alba x Populus x berolinensis]